MGRVCKTSSHHNSLTVDWLGCVLASVSCVYLIHRTIQVWIQKSDQLKQQPRFIADFQSTPLHLCGFRVRCLEKSSMMDLYLLITYEVFLTVTILRHCLLKIPFFTDSLVVTNSHSHSNSNNSDDLSRLMPFCHFNLAVLLLCPLLFFYCQLP